MALCTFYALCSLQNQHRATASHVTKTND